MASGRGGQPRSWRPRMHNHGSTCSAVRVTILPLRSQGRGCVHARGTHTRGSPRRRGPRASGRGRPPWCRGGPPPRSHRGGPGGSTQDAAAGLWGHRTTTPHLCGVRVASPLRHCPRPSVLGERAHRGVPRWLHRQLRLGCACDCDCGRGEPLCGPLAAACACCALELHPGRAPHLQRRRAPSWRPERRPGDRACCRGSPIDR